MCVYSSRVGLNHGQKTMFSDNVKWKVENVFPHPYILHCPFSIYQSRLRLVLIMEVRSFSSSVQSASMELAQTLKFVILSEALAESKNLRTYGTFAVKSVRRSFDSLCSLRMTRMIDGSQTGNSYPQQDFPFSILHFPLLRLSTC